MTPDPLRHAALVEAAQALAELPCGRETGLPQSPGWYLWHILDLNYLEVGVVQVQHDPEKHMAYLRGVIAEGKDSRQFYLYQNDAGEWLTMYHSSFPHVLPTCAPDGKPYVDGYEPFDWYWRDLSSTPANRTAAARTALLAELAREPAWSETVTEPGCYPWREVPDDRPRLVDVWDNSGDLCITMNGVTMQLSAYGGEYGPRLCGPILCPAAPVSPPAVRERKAGEE